MNKTVYMLLAGALLASPAGADTVHLNNGVSFDGVVTPVPDQPGIFKVTAGDRSLIYRESEIREIEKNERTGSLDKAELLARWEEKNKQLTEETGLTAEQRRLIRGLMFELKSENVAQRVAVREKLIGLQAQMDVFGYLRKLYPELSTLIAPNVLEAMFYLDNVRIAEVLKESVHSNYFGIRAMALDLLGRLNDAGSVELVARGLADHKQPVQIAAAYVLARLGVKEASPALIDLLPHPDERVSNAARESLVTLWAEQLGDPKPQTVDEWKAFLSSQIVSGAPIELAKLESLSLPEEEVTQSIDSNHGTPPAPEG